MIWKWDKLFPILLLTVILFLMTLPEQAEAG